MTKARDIADLGAVTSRLDTVGASDGALSNRNLIINGAMQVAQRGTSFTGATTDGYYAIDRMKTKISTGASGTHTITQSTNAPIGFSNSYKIDCTTAQASPNQLRLMHTVEGYNVSHLNYNTSDAVQTTLSFWVKSNVTGTYAFSIETTTSGRYFNTTYTINAANTWEYKTISIVGDTSSSLNSGNGVGLTLSWWLAAPASLKGSGTPDTWVTNASYTSLADGHGVNIAGSTSNEWQITGVQLEVGDTATPFEHRSYGDELARCQRYTFIISAAGYTPATDSAYNRYQMFGAGSTVAKWITTLPVTMRATPSLITNNFTSSTVQVYNYSTNTSLTFSSVGLNESGKNSVQTNITVTSGVVLGNYVTWRWNNSPAAYIGFDAEL
jgi:hypothetical protein